MNGFYTISASFIRALFSHKNEIYDLMRGNRNSRWQVEIFNRRYDARASYSAGFLPTRTTCHVAPTRENAGRQTFLHGGRLAVRNPTGLGHCVASPNVFCSPELPYHVDRIDDHSVPHRLLSEHFLDAGLQG